METVISVGRDGVEIGDFNLQSIHQGLASGYFLPSDYGWFVGLTEWLPLSNIVDRVKQAGAGLEAIDGNVKYTLKDTPKSLKRRRKRPVEPPSHPHDWHDDPATEKQLLYLKSLGAKVTDPLMTKGRASELIQQFQNVVSELSPKQIACLQYHDLDVTTLSLGECWAYLDQIHHFQSNSINRNLGRKRSIASTPISIPYHRPAAGKISLHLQF